MGRIMTSRLQQIIILMGTVLYVNTFLVSCGPAGSSAPQKKYDQVRKNSVPAKPVTVREQVYIGSDIYSIKTESNLAFIAGQQSEIKIKAMLQIPGAKYRLISQDLPEGAKLVKDPSNPLFAILSWKPSSDIIPRGQREIKGEFHVAIDVQGVPDPQSTLLLKTINTETTLFYTVSIAQDRPTIVGIKGLPETVVEGSVIDNFTVEVKDIVSDKSNPPSLEIYYKGQESGEGIKANGTMFVALKGAPVKAEGQGNWIFNLTFDTKTLAVPEFSDEGKRNKNPSLDITFYLKVISANSAISAEAKIDRTIVYNKAILKPQFSISQESVEVAQGSLLHLAFSTMLTNGRGALAIKLNDGISEWPGQPKLNCITVNDPAVEMQTCDFAWQVPCDAKDGEYSLQVLAGATYNDKTSSSVLTKTIKVNLAEVCQPVKKDVPDVSETAKPAAEVPATIPNTSATPVTEVKPKSSDTVAAKPASSTKKSLSGTPKSTHGHKETQHSNSSAKSSKAKGSLSDSKKSKNKGNSNVTKSKKALDSKTINSDKPVNNDLKL